MNPNQQNDEQYIEGEKGLESASNARIPLERVSPFICYTELSALARTICSNLQTPEELTTMRLSLFGGQPPRLWLKPEQERGAVVLTMLQNLYDVTVSNDDRDTINATFARIVTQNQQKRFVNYFDLEVNRAGIEAAGPPSVIEATVGLGPNLSFGSQSQLTTNSSKDVLSMEPVKEEYEIPRAEPGGSISESAVWRLCREHQQVFSSGTAPQPQVDAHAAQSQDDEDGDTKRPASESVEEAQAKRTKKE